MYLQRYLIHPVPTPDYAAVSGSFFSIPILDMHVLQDVATAGLD